MPAVINKPEYIESPVRNSGNMGGTGQSAWTQGGGQAFSQLSGVVAATLLASGPGRLDSIGWCAAPFNSGQGAIFYDAPLATSGGPFATSGHRVLGFLPPQPSVPAGMVSGFAAATGQPFLIGAPFNSGLCVAPWPGTVSGVASFYGTYTLAGLLSGGTGIASVPTLLPSP